MFIELLDCKLFGDSYNIIHTIYINLIITVKIVLKCSHYNDYWEKYLTEHIKRSTCVLL